MEKLEKYISANRGSFDSEEPLPGHLEKFRNKLNFAAPVKRTNLFLVASAAAIAGIIVTAGISLLLTYTGLQQINGRDQVSINLSPEVTRIDEFYKIQVSKKQEEINVLIGSSSNPWGDEIYKTLNDLGEGYTNIMNDISNSPNEDRAVYALTLHYQAKLEAMQQIIYKLKNVSMLNMNY